MFKRFGEAAMQVMHAAAADSERFSSPVVGTQHLLLGLTRSSDCLAARALESMGVNVKSVSSELQQINAPVEAASTGLDPRSSFIEYEVQPVYSDLAQEALGRAKDHCRYFGEVELKPEHILLAVVDVDKSGAVKILEELGANLSFLRRHVMHLMAKQYSSNQTVQPLRTALVTSLTDLIDSNLECARSLATLARRSSCRVAGLPERREIVHMVLTGYMPDLLCTQVAFQRHLLQEALKLLEQRTGPLEQESTATIVSNSAQHLRLEVRNTIEYLWSNEYKLLDQMLNDAEHDLIGSVIEDLWWAHSEEIALHELFDEALEDHRRKQLLSLQKRRLEIAHRLTKLRIRLIETVQQCFRSRSNPA